MLDPFRKPLHEVESRDLHVLKEVSEGWYIDYKQDLIDLKDIAKHLTSFANTYGGWIFFGIKEHTATHAADKFIGINGEVLDTLLTRLREASSAHSFPTVYFETKTIKGPCAEIELDADKYILIVKISEGEEPPYVHSSGRIYKRTADHSKPEAETNRYAIDRLFDKSASADTLLKQFIDDSPHLHKKQSEDSILHIYLLPQSSDESSLNQIKIDDFKTICCERKTPFSLNFDHVFPSKYGFTARYVQENHFYYFLPTLRFWHNGRFKISIPINSFSIDGYMKDPRFKHKKELITMVDIKKSEDLKILDLTQVGVILSCFLNTIIDIKKRTMDHRDLLCAVKTTNTGGKCPYIDKPQYFEHCKKYGIPILLENSLQIPTHIKKSYLLPLEMQDYFKSNSEEIIPFPASTLVPILILLFEGLGIHIGQDNPIELLLTI
ncbi:MAG: ATP-binding protein [Holophagaceae bacterium]